MQAFLKKLQKEANFEKIMYLCIVKVIYFLLTYLNKLFIMKKLVLILTVIATVVCFSSCKKTCVCKSYYMGEVIQTASEVELEKGYKDCSEMTAIVDFPEFGKMGTVCE